MLQTLISFLLAGTLNVSRAGTALNDQGVFDERTLLSVARVPVQQEEYVAPGYMTASAILSIDLESQSVLYEKNSNARVPIASLTKLMTAYIILEENNPDSIVTVSANAASAIGSSMRLYAGEEISVKNLLYGLLIESGNDAAVALAEYNAGSESAFVKKMNQKAKDIGMANTNYVNTMGLDSSAAYSSARDLALLSSYLVTDPSIRAIVSLQSTEVSGTDGHIHKLSSTNILLGELGVKGLKTGKTPAAGECLITLAANPEGHEIITIVLGSGNRFSDTRTLLEWIYSAYVW